MQYDSPFPKEAERPRNECDSQRPYGCRSIYLNLLFPGCFEISFDSSLIGVQIQTERAH